LIFFKIYYSRGLQILSDYVKKFNQCNKTKGSKHTLMEIEETKEVTDIHLILKLNLAALKVP